MLDLSPKFELDATLKVLNIRLEALWNDHAPRWQSRQIQPAVSASHGGGRHASDRCGGDRRAARPFDIPSQIVIEDVGGRDRTGTLYGCHRGASRADEDPRSYSMEAATPCETVSSRNGHPNEFAGENMISAGDNEPTHSTPALETAHS